MKYFFSQTIQLCLKYQQSQKFIPSLFQSRLVKFFFELHNFEQGFGSGNGSGWLSQPLPNSWVGQLLVKKLNFCGSGSAEAKAAEASLKSNASKILILSLLFAIKTTSFMPTTTLQYLVNMQMNSHLMLVQNSQKLGRSYWAIHFSARLFTCTAHLFTCSEPVPLIYLHRSYVCLLCTVHSCT